MFERDHYGLNPEFQNAPLPGGVAPSHHALAKRRYLEERKIRLEGEALERRHQASVEQERAIAKATGKMSKTARALFDLLTMHPRKKVK